MILACEKCNTRFKLDEKAVKKPNFRARCSVCKHIFNAHRPVRVEELYFLNLDEARRAGAGDKIIAISNQKGGVGKTTSCLNLGAALARMKKRVLLVDFDVQSNLTMSLGANNAPSFYELITSLDDHMAKLVKKTKYPNLWLLPSNSNLVLLTKKYFGADHFEFLLKDRLYPIKGQFDFIVIDTPPSIELLTLNALTAANLVIIPSHSDYLSIQGVTQIVKLINLTKRKTNPNLAAKILMTMFDSQSVASKAVSTKLNGLYQGQILNTIIDLDPRVKESQIMSMPVIYYDNKSPASVQYAQLASEILQIMS